MTHPKDVLFSNKDKPLEPVGSIVSVSPHLDRIASALGVAPSFFSERLSGSLAAQGQTIEGFSLTEEGRELLAFYMDVKTPAVRQRILQMIREIARNP